MATINVRQLDDDVVRRLKRRAAGNDRSLEGEVRRILARAVEDDVEARREAFRALAARLRRKAGGSPQTPSEVLIREDRDGGHRLGAWWSMPAWPSNGWSRKRGRTRRTAC